MNEAAWFLAEGCPVEQLDQAMVDWGFPVGPFVLLDEVGIDVAAKVGKIVKEAFGDRVDPPPGTMDTLVADGRLGRKAGKGFYLYEGGKKKGVDPTVYEALGVKPDARKFKAEEIQERLSLAMVNEAALCLEEGILRSARDGDIGAIFGLGFPPFRGGPFAHTDTVGAATVMQSLHSLAGKLGKRFAPAQIIQDHARDQKRFRG